jgi:hypothetical protein
MNCLGLENLRAPYKCKRAAAGLKVTEGTNGHPAKEWMINETNSKQRQQR